MPFFAEEMYQGLKTAEMPESVHLCDWPKTKKESHGDADLENKMDEAFKEFKDSTFKKIGQLFGKPLTTQSAEWSGQATWKVSKEVFLHVDDNWNLILVKRKTTEHDEYEDTDISEVSLEDMDNGSVDKLIKSAKELATSNIAESLAFDGDLL